jgi:hypothetical protein
MVEKQLNYQTQEFLFIKNGDEHYIGTKRSNWKNNYHSQEFKMKKEVISWKF